jgi:hypothetical protein
MQRSGGIVDEKAHKAEISQRKWQSWLENLGWWVCTKYEGRALDEAVEVIDVATKAGSRAEVPRFERNLLDKLDKLFTAAGRPSAPRRAGPGSARGFGRF